MEGLKVVPVVILMIAIVGVIAGAAAITLASFGGNIQDKCWNSSWTYSATYDACQNATPYVAALGQGGYDTRNLSSEYYSVVLAQESQSDVSEQLPTVAIISIMVIIISLISGVFVYMRYFG